MSARLTIYVTVALLASAGTRVAFAAAPTPIFAVADAANNFVDIYDQTNLRLLRRLRGFLGVSGVAYDAAGSLYVADRKAGRVFVFGQGRDKPFRVLGDYAKFPSDVVVATNGTAFVSNAIGNITPAGIAVFGPKASLPNTILSSPKLRGAALQSINNVTTDGTGDVLLTYDYAGRDGVAFGLGEFAGARPPMHVLNPNLGSFPAIRAYGATLYVATANQFLIVPAPYTAASSSFTLTNTITAQGFDFTTDGTNVLVTDANGAAVRKYSVPSGALLQTLFTGGQPVSLAAWPMPFQ